MNLKTPLKALSGIGSYYAYKLQALGIVTIEDLINHYPFRYDDFSNVSSVSLAKEGEKVTLQGELWSIDATYTRLRKVITKAIFNDGSGPVELIWFNNPWIVKTLKAGDKLQISGKVSLYKNKYSIIAPTWERLSSSNNSIHTGGLIPVYPETEGLSSKWIRAKIATLLPHIKNQIEDPLPDHIKGDMLSLPEAIQKIHFPENFKEVTKARERLSFDELFFIQLSSQLVKKEWKQKPIVKPFEIDTEKLDQFIVNLPFKLTEAQIKVIADICYDLRKHEPMNRLVQGEVGSGKTVVAAAIMYLTHLNNLHSLYMAPTEILAFQHHRTVSSLLEPYGIKVGIYTGSRKKAKNCDITIGTHALLSKKLEAENLGLIVVDEQQRFGVEQRSLLRARAKVPHFLTMTATPIPRTVALTLYGDLDLSVIDQMPMGRRLVKTHVVPARKRKDAYAFIAKKVEQGDQAYIITPLIELSETLTTVKAATVEYDRLRKQIFQKFKLGLLHGRLKSKEKDETLNDFKDKKLDILVSTSVVEVGVDVPNATIMVIESAERFGLAQLHQLRGRVGRGEKESFCLLFTENHDSSIYSRLKNLEKIYSGLILAELDMKIRGSGQIFGKLQAGRFELKIASLTNLDLVQKTKKCAQQLLEQDPKLDKHPLLKAKLPGPTGGVMPD